MPILEKHGQRVLFAHIPKTAGTSIYLAFAAAGWRILNLSENPEPGSAFQLLNARHGVSSIERTGSMRGYPHPPQHAPHFVWKNWGPFAQSFAVVRDPFARLKSALKYHYQLRDPRESLEAFADAQIKRAKSVPFMHWLILGGHLVPQWAYLGPETKVFRFEEPWQKYLCAHFDLAEDSLQVTNVSAGADFELTEAQISAVRRLYRRDFARLGYDPSMREAG